MNMRISMEQMEELLAPGYRVGIYCRLSKDDDIRNRESLSIGHQRDMLTAYCEKRGWLIEEIYVDDGYSGLNQNRPELIRLLEDVENKRINLVITKDYSRLGRNHLQTEQLREEFFPRHNCRYIAINDNIDSLYEDELAGFKAVINEQYSRDIAKKVHSSYQLQAEHGKYTGCVPPFGYKKDPDEKGHLIIDEETADAVRLIFDYAKDGRGVSYIKRRLEAKKIPCPSWWLRQRGIRDKYTKWELADPENGKYVWDESVLKDMLMSPIYYGAVCGQKINYKFKLGVLSEKKPEEWIIVENMHEPIVDRDTFETIQAKVKSRKCSRGDGTFSLFAGLIRCGDCGKALTIRRTNAKNPIEIYSCVTYHRHGKNHCTQHRVEFDRLYDICLNEIRQMAQKAVQGEDITANLTESLIAERKSRQEARRKALAKAKDKLEALDRLVVRLYNDSIEGKINDSTFETMMKKTQDEQDMLKVQIAEYEDYLNTEDEDIVNHDRWTEMIKEYADIKELDAEILNRVIKQIVVHENIEEDGTRNMSLEIRYNFKAEDDTITHDISYNAREATASPAV